MEWIKTSDRLPKDEELVYIWGPESGYFISTYRFNKFNCTPQPTHWQPLPEPPKE